MINLRTRFSALLAGVAVSAALLVLPGSPAAAQTVATTAMRQSAADWQAGVRARGGTATVSGIVGDAAHGQEGYHRSREDVIRWSGGDYSTWYARDRRGPSNAASAVDLNMDRAWMVSTTRRGLAACRAGDSRMSNVRAFNGTLDGVSGVRVEVAEGCTLYWATPDHTWHIHVEFFRDSADKRQTGWTAVALGVPAVPARSISQQASIICPVRHDAVKVLQRVLNKVGYGPRVAVDGVCGTYTIRALHTFQKREGLPISNRVTPATWAVLSRAYHRAA